MDPRLLDEYNKELAYLRQEAREFGEEHDAVASRLGLKTPTDPDPYVERLLEGVAFLSARVQLKQNDQYPEFTHHLLHAVQPHYLAPTPSMCIVGFEPKGDDPGLETGSLVPKGTQLTAEVPQSGRATVVYKTGHDVTLWPLKITKAEYLPSRASIAAYAQGGGFKAEAGLKLTLTCTSGKSLPKLDPKTLSIYIDGSESIPGELYRQLTGDAISVLAGPPNAPPSSYRSLPVPHQIGFDDQEALLPAEARTYRGYRLLQEYFNCAERYFFAGIRQLKTAFAACEDTCDIVILFSRSVPMLAGALSVNNFRLFATPCINLFEKQLARVQCEAHKHEYHVVPDQTRPLDFEVFRLNEVKAYTKDNKDARTVAPLYAFGALLYDWSHALFYTTKLTDGGACLLMNKESARTHDYVGTETWLSITAPGQPALLEDIRELSVKAWVTNREWPELLSFKGDRHFNIAAEAVDKVSILRAPTRPRPPLGLHDAAWRVIGHLTPNYASLIEQPDGDPSLLKDHLTLYGRQDDASTRKQIDGILSVTSRMVTRRIPGQDRNAMARGHLIRIKLDDASFDRGRLFLFCAVIERFLSEFTTINTFTECEFETPLEGVFMRWPPRIGRQHTI